MTIPTLGQTYRAGPNIQPSWLRGKRIAVESVAHGRISVAVLSRVKTERETVFVWDGEVIR